MSRLSDARSTLHAALVAQLAPTVLDASRVHEYEPEQIVSPCVWIGTPTISVRDVGSPGARLALCSFPVYVTADGISRAQQVTNEELVANVWDASSYSRSDPVLVVPRMLDLSNAPNTTSAQLRGNVVTVEVIVAARTFCPSNITTTTTTQEVSDG